MRKSILCYCLFIKHLLGVVLCLVLSEGGKSKADSWSRADGSSGNVPSEHEPTRGKLAGVLWFVIATLTPLTPEGTTLRTGSSIKAPGTEMTYRPPRRWLKAPKDVFHISSLAKGLGLTLRFP